jgi:NTE family protein
MTCAWVFSGGGALGAVQAGMVRAIVEDDGPLSRPDLLIGVSAGALNAAYLSAGVSPDRVSSLWQMWRSDIVTGLREETWMPKLARIARWERHLASPVPLGRLIDLLCASHDPPLDDIAGARVPLHVATSVLGTGAQQWFSSGDARQVLLASASVPGILPPVAIDGVEHIDGAIHTALPVHRAVELGADTVVAFTVPRFTDPTADRLGAAGVVLRAMSISRWANIPDKIPGVDLHVIESDLPAASASAVSRVGEYLYAGYAAGLSHLRDRPQSAEPRRRLLTRRGQAVPTPRR